MQITPLTELQDRVGRLQKKLQEEGLDGALIMENTDLFYFTGSMQQGFFFAPAWGDPLYYVRRNYERACTESSWTNIVRLSGLRELPAILRAHDYRVNRLGLELDVLPVNNCRRLQELLPGMAPIDISVMLREVRMIKSPYELACFRRAGEMARAVNRQIPALLEVGKAELYLSAELENLYRLAGHPGVLRMRAFNSEMFFGHVYSGKNGAWHTFLDSCTGGLGITTANPQSAGWKTLAPHEPIGVDYAVIYEGYILDYTRVFSLGELAADLQKAYAAAAEIQEELIRRAYPGTLCTELYRLAVEIAAGWGLGDYFMGCGPEQVKFVGHGIGLEIDELPIIGPKSPHVLEQGMVFALEPKFIFPGRGMIGLENSWCVTDRLPEKLSPIPDELVIVPL